MVDEYKEKINITYILNNEKRGSSSFNLNVAIKNCSGEYIKILMMDEFLYGNDSLTKLVTTINNSPKTKWILSGCLFGTYSEEIKGKMIPKYDENIILGINTIGSPSVLTIKNDDCLLFNEDLIWLMDCDYYKRLYDKFGTPTIINDYLIYVSQHNDQLTNLISNEIKQIEHKTLLNFKKNGIYK